MNKMRMKYINDYIKDHLNDKADDVINYINTHLEQFIDGTKPLTKQAYWTRKCRIKKIDINNE